MKSLLPMIMIVLLLTGAITYSLSKRAVPQPEANRFGIAANELETNSADTTITPSVTPARTGFNFLTPTPAVTSAPTPTPTIVSQPAILPTVSEKNTPVKKTVANSKTVVCTPVYGQANTCTEHVVVDTGAADAIFFNFAGLSYLAGLASFILAKRA